MLNVVTNLETRRIGKPQNWDPDTPCEEISVIDTEIPIGPNLVTFMMTLWKPTPEELEILNKGGFLRLGISGKQHPVMFIDFINPEQVTDDSTPT